MRSGGGEGDGKSDEKDGGGEGDGCVVVFSLSSCCVANVLLPASRYVIFLILFSSSCPRCVFVNIIVLNVVNTVVVVLILCVVVNVVPSSRQSTTSFCQVVSCRRRQHG
jgi:hypothetical protein